MYSRAHTEKCRHPRLIVGNPRAPGYRYFFICAYTYLVYVGIGMWQATSPCRPRGYSATGRYTIWFVDTLCRQPARLSTPAKRPCGGARIWRQCSRLVGNLPRRISARAFGIQAPRITVGAAHIVATLMAGGKRSGTVAMRKI